MPNARTVDVMRLICVLAAIEAAGVAVIAVIAGQTWIYVYASVTLTCSALLGALSIGATHLKLPARSRLAASSTKTRRRRLLRWRSRHRPSRCPTCHALIQVPHDGSSAV